MPIAGLDNLDNVRYLLTQNGIFDATSFAAFIGKDVLTGLQTIHSKKIYHCHLKLSPTTKAFQGSPILDEASNPILPALKGEKAIIGTNLLNELCNFVFMLISMMPGLLAACFLNSSQLLANVPGVFFPLHCNILPREHLFAKEPKIVPRMP
jgi:hypothetical protein